MILIINNVYNNDINIEINKKFSYSIKILGSSTKINITKDAKGRNQFNDNNINNKKSNNNNKISNKNNQNNKYSIITIICRVIANA